MSTIKVLVKKPTIGSVMDTMNEQQTRAVNVAVGISSILSFVVGMVMIGAFWFFIG